MQSDFFSFFFFFSRTIELLSRFSRATREGREAFLFLFSILFSMVHGCPFRETRHLIFQKFSLLLLLLRLQAFAILQFFLSSFFLLWNRNCCARNNFIILAKISQTRKNAKIEKKKKREMDDVKKKRRRRKFLPFSRVLNRGNKEGTEIKPLYLKILPLLGRQFLKTVHSFPCRSFRIVDKKGEAGS